MRLLLARSNTVIQKRYYFRQFRKALDKKGKDSIVKVVYRWIDQLELREPSLQYFIEKFGDNELKGYITGLTKPI